jgi:cytochrome c peroxidase
MSPAQSIKLSLVCGAVLGTSVICSTAFAQSPSPTPCVTPAPNAFATPTPAPANTSPSPPPGVQQGGVAVPVPVLNMGQYLPGGANFGADPWIPFLLNDIQAQFNDALEKLAFWQTNAPGSSLVTQYLGKALIYDQSLSVNNNLACATCHIEYSAFTGGSSFFNSTTSADPGSVPITNARGQGPNERISARKPQTYAYAPFSPVLHYNNTQQDFYGGNFWDMRAGGIRLGNPAAEQAQGPPTNPVEMGNLDLATYIYKLSKTPEARFFQAYWGMRSLKSIKWPANIQVLAATPGPPPSANNPTPVLAMLVKEDQDLVIYAYDHAAQSMAAYEAAPEVSSFTSKFDYALANPTQQVLSTDELAGWNLFRGKAHCNTCHLDGTENSTATTVTPADAADVAPYFTDFTSANIGMPQNFALPYLYEDKPDQFGYTANPDGICFVDLGVGAFLRNTGFAQKIGQPPNNIGTGRNPNPNWVPLAPNFDGKVQTPTLRDVDFRPRADFVKAYMHNGYLKSLKAVVHFYNTRDTLNGGVHLPAGTTTYNGQPVKEGIDYWPPPEVDVNVDETIGHLGLTDAEENQIVAFLKALSDGFVPVTIVNGKPSNAKQLAAAEAAAKAARVPPKWLRRPSGQH